MTIALIGSTGRVGSVLPALFRAQGWNVRMLKRNSTGDEPETVSGDATIPEDVLRLVTGCDAVVNCVGRLKNADGLHARVTNNVIAAMKRSSVRRYLLVSNAAVALADDEDTLPRRLGRLLFRMVFPRMMEDKQAEAHALQDCGLDWTLVRLPLVVSGQSPNDAVALPHRLGGWTVRLDQVGFAIVRMLRTGQHSGEAPFLYSP